MKVSIITVSYNNAATIRDTIESVFAQTHKEIEYIVIDGGSTDGTVEILKAYQNKIAFWVSEKDNGLYDAMNKGIAKATGDIVGTLNADDFYAVPTVVARVVKTFTEKQCEAVWGNIYYVAKEDPRIIRRTWVASAYAPKKFQHGWAPPHPTFFVKRSVYEKYGGFNTKFRISADYELMLRFLEKYKITSQYLPEFFVKMRVGGKSNKTFFHRLWANWEVYLSWRENKLPVNIFLLAWKPFSKIAQVFK